MEKILYYVEPQDSFEAEGRYFYKGEQYPVLENESSKGYVILTSENGTFNFKESLMEEAITEWGLKKHNTKSE